MPTGLQQRCFRRQSSEFENPRSEIENRVDAGKLVEERDRETRAGSGREAASSRNVRAEPARLTSRDNFVSLGSNFFCGAVRLDHASTASASVAVAFATEQPARTLRQTQAKQRVKQ